MINSIDHAVITLLDALEGIPLLKICIGYELDGQMLESWPIQAEIIDKCKPVYKTLNGWEQRTREEWSEIAGRGYDALPENIKEYIQTIKEELQVDIAMISIGPNRNDTIELSKDIF